MSLLEKAPPSIFVQDQRPITKKQVRTVMADLSLFCQGILVLQWPNRISVLLKIIFYWLTKKKRMHRINFAFMGFCFSIHKMTAACLCLTHQRGSSAPLSHSCPVSFPDWPELSFFSVSPIPRLWGKLGASCNESGSASSSGKSTAGNVPVQGDKDSLVDTLCTVVCRRARINAYLSQVKPATADVNGMARTKRGMLIPAITQWVPCSI